MRPELDYELAQHRAEPFPTSVEKGEEYGGVDAVLVGADIVGWASQADFLDSIQRRSLREIADDLSESLDAFPEDARPYYRRLLRIARLALATD